MTPSGTGKPALTVHIGLGKTGTTVLQRFFDSNRKALGEYGICYPSYGQRGFAQHLLSPFIPNGLDDWSFIPAVEWAPELADNGERSTLVSSELISACDADTARQFCNTLKDHFTLKIVAYLRRQDEIIMANYNQHVKTGRQRRRLEEVLDDMLAQFDYLATLQPWAESVSPDSFIVRPYAHEQFFGGDIRRDFMHHVFGLDSIDGLVLDGSDPNPRLGNKTLALKRLLNILVKGPGQRQELQNLFTRHHREAESIAGGSGSGLTLLSPSARQDIVDHFAESNEAIAKQFLGREDGRLFGNDIPGSDGDWSENTLTAHDMDTLIAFFWKRDPALLASLSDNATAYLDDTDTQLQQLARSLRASANAL